MFRAVWDYRNFILSSIIGEFKSRFARSRLGGIWMILNPLAQVAIYAIILSHLMSSRLQGVNYKYSYIIYLMAGTLTWSLFSEIVTRCLTVFIDNSNLLKKIIFPRICLPIIILGSSLVNNSLLLFSIVFISAILGHWPNFSITFLPIMVILTSMLGIGLGIVLGVLNVFIRDIGQVIPILLQFGYWLTPIVYMPTIIPEHYRHWLAFNPLYPVVNSYHRILVFGIWPDFKNLLWVILLGFFLLGIGLFLFRKASPEMVDVL